VVFATGSLYLVGDLHRYWEQRPAGEASGLAMQRPTRR